jgi:hypothetical protein
MTAARRRDVLKSILAAAATAGVAGIAMADSPFTAAAQRGVAIGAVQ